MHFSANVCINEHRKVCRELLRSCVYRHHENNFIYNHKSKTYQIKLNNYILKENMVNSTLIVN